MTFFAIVGNGPNGLEIPLVVCKTREEAEAIVEQLPKHETHPDSLADDFAECDGEYRTDDDEPSELYKLIFKDGNYYAGCGGCYAVEIKEYEFGVPMVGWDLD